jgi:L-malate glycosyltransferase
LKVLIYSHQLEIGGNQNAIDLAASLRDLHGYQVVFFATPGPNLHVVEEKRLRFVAAPAACAHPSPSRMWALRELVRQERPDLLHAWEYYQCLDAYYVEHLLMRVPMSVTGMLMDVSRLLPKGLPLTLGTPELVDRAGARGWRSVSLLVPPVDVRRDAPEAVSGTGFRARLGVRPGEILVVTVSRLSGLRDIKAESLIRTIGVIDQLAGDLPLRFAIVGEGELRADLQRIAADINALHKRDVIVLTGAMLDPRPAYAAADIFVGMGGSALRAMAFAKPTVIVGARGFTRLLGPDTAESVYRQGIYGTGDGGAGNAGLSVALRRLAEDVGHRRRLGAYSRDFVTSRFALDQVSAAFARFCECAVNDQPQLGRDAMDGLRTAAIWARERRWNPS